MACHLSGVTPLSKPMLDYCFLDIHKQLSMKFHNKYATILIQENVYKISSVECRAFSLGLNKLTEPVMTQFWSVLNVDLTFHFSISIQHTFNVSGINFAHATTVL